MKKRKRIQQSVNLKRKKKILREKVRLGKVVGGLINDLSINAIHHRTGLSEKKIRKIMRNNANEITFLLLKQNKNG